MREVVCLIENLVDELDIYNTTPYQYSMNVTFWWGIWDGFGGVVGTSRSGMSGANETRLRVLEQRAMISCVRRKVC